jgi:hypothetical protein
VTKRRLVGRRCLSARSLQLVLVDEDKLEDHKEVIELQAG